jgi:sodium/hydrogen exchanger 8
LLLGIAFLVGYFLQTRHITWFPEAGAFLILGVIAGAIFHSFEEHTGGLDDKLIYELAAYMKFDKKSFFLVFLPPIIFESAYNLRSRKFFANLDAILLLAVYGTLAATILTGVLVKFAGDAGWSHPFDWLPSMLFGSLISATDPVTVLALFSELNADINLYSMVYGESVLNDAVALVMYKTVLTFKETEFNAQSALAATGTFLKIFISSTLIGVLFAIMVTMVYRYTKLYEKRFFFLEIALSAVFPYASWMVSDALGLSGIVAVLFCGIGMAHWTKKNLSLAAQDFTAKFYKILAILSETLVFIALGMAVTIYSHVWNWGWFLIATLICLAARAFNVYPVCFVCNLWRKQSNKISHRIQFVLWMSGLRGAIAFALAFDARNDSFFAVGDDGKAIFSATVFIVFFTIFVIGSPTAKILMKLDVLQGAETSDAPLTGRSARLMTLDEKYLGRFILHPRGKRPAEIEMQALGEPTQPQSQPRCKKLPLVFAAVILVCSMVLLWPSHTQQALPRPPPAHTKAPHTTLELQALIVLLAWDSMVSTLLVANMAQSVTTTCKAMGCRASKLRQCLMRLVLAMRIGRQTEERSRDPVT